MIMIDIVFKFYVFDCEYITETRSEAVINFKARNMPINGRIPICKKRGSQKRNTCRTAVGFPE
jgi:hypothetical protein